MVSRLLQPVSNENLGLPLPCFFLQVSNRAHRYMIWDEDYAVIIEDS